METKNGQSRVLLITNTIICHIFMLNMLNLKLLLALKTVKYWLESYRTTNWDWFRHVIELHRDELKAGWEIATSGEKPYKIAPL